MSHVELPRHPDLQLPTLLAVQSLGGSGSINEIQEATSRIERFTEDQEAILHGDGPQTELSYRLAWARTYLKNLGLLSKGGRGIWSLTEEGTKFLDDPGMSQDDRVQKLRQLTALWQQEVKQASSTGIADTPLQTSQGPDEAAANVEAQADANGDDAWREEVLELLLAMQPEAFERLAQRLLREADVDNVTVTARSNDGGIDGVGVYRLGLVTFPVFFQCKRYRGSVGPGAVRDFRGAMAGRGDKGLVITTGNFTTEAKREARRDGAPAVELIDGERLVDLLKQYGLGISTVVVEQVQIDPAFYEEI